MTRREILDLIEDLENTNIAYSDIEESFESMKEVYKEYNLDWDFNDYVNNEELTEMAKDTLNKYGLQTLAFFLPENLNENIYHIDGYGNAENVSTNDMEDMANNLAAQLKNMISFDPLNEEIYNRIAKRDKICDGMLIDFLDENDISPEDFINNDLDDMCDSISDLVASKKAGASFDASLLFIQLEVTKELCRIMYKMLQEKYCENNK